MQTHRKFRRDRTGAVLPLIAIFIAAMILVLGLMVELNWLYTTRFEAQSASDLAARSALAHLYDNTGNLDQAAIDRSNRVGVQIYEANFPAHPITEDNLIFGRLRPDDSFAHLNDQGRFRQINASQVQYDQRFTPLLGTLLAKEEVNLPVFSVAEAQQIEMVYK